MLGFAVGRWGVGSLCGNYHKTIIQNLRSNTKANTKQSNDKTENRKKNRKAGRKKPRRLGRGGVGGGCYLILVIKNLAH